MMRRYRSHACAAIAALSVLMLSAVALRAAETIDLPKEVTPAIRAACEADVRRLCIGPNPTMSKVKDCVLAKFFQLGRRCQTELASAGLSP